MRRIIKSAAIALVCALAISCSESSTPNQSQPTPQGPLRSPAELTQNESGLLESANKFGLNLFREVAHSSPDTGNVFISPLSVSYAFGICYNAADGETRDAIGATLQLAGLSVVEMNEAYRDVTRILTRTDPLVTFSVANSFWSRLGKQIQPDFIAMAQDYYDSRIEEIDFQQPWAADTINAWVSQATNGKITEMVKPPIDPSTAAILMNAIYFKGNWMFPFDTAHTRLDTFHLADGSEAQCDMMWLFEDEHAVQVDEYTIEPDTNATYFGNEQLQAVSLPYGRGDYRMTIIMPNTWMNPNLTVDDLIDQFTWENWNSWLAGLRPAEFVIGLPRLKFGYEVKLNQMLQALGMEIAFDPNRADFSNMFIDGVGWIDEVKQKAFVQVDEKGTEAAAVTQVIFADALPPILVCDRPFLIVIHEDVSGAILFIGKIANPVWEE